ncbi:NERD domain-containing protein [Sporosarcina sp. E16_8]|uniref:NERD domain-containing protein n=1 Tax=Sporosarcina sp. E16_8 TaxID=2789295 RepID=UPI001A91F1FB|nr:NERD domain-containing protein [Sporosarcina sp. E16_8]MBO0587077.1 NERD domain-containing protein [Sporosarcina sp. E16_8]
MIIKKRGISGTFAGLASLVSRISESDEMFKRIKSDYKNCRAGFAGELRVDNFLEELELKMPYYVLQNLTIKVGKKRVQIDTILIHPNFILVIEIKNMRGEFYFDPVNKHFYRLNDEGKKEGMRNPEAQLSRSTTIIDSFLRDKGIEMSAKGLIVFVSRAGIVMQASEKWKTIPLDSLVEYIELLEDQTKRVVPSETCKRLALELLAEDRPEKLVSIVDYYNVSVDKVKKGVRCPGCNYIPMLRKHSRWCCGKCGEESRDAHLNTLQEYRLLFGPEITSRSAIDFMQHNSIYFAIRVLTNNAEIKKVKARYRLFQINDEKHLLSEFIREELKK